MMVRERRRSGRGFGSSRRTVGAFASERRRADHAREDADLRRRANDSFHELDKNDDGHVSRSELIRALRLPKNAYLCEVGV